jgi:DNA-binding XRE family transcriptional regulator
MNTEEPTKTSRLEEGARRYARWRDELMSDPENRRMYEEEAAKSDLWLQLAEAREAAGLTQTELARRLGVSRAQVARIEKRGYDAYTLTTLRRYVQALSGGFSLEVRVQQPGRVAGPTSLRPNPI